jgi:hypothetical protein
VPEGSDVGHFFDHAACSQALRARPSGAESVAAHLKA